MDEFLAGIPESAQARFKELLEQEPLETAQLVARVEAFRAIEVEAVKGADLASVVRVAGLVSRALTLLDRADHAAPEERQQIQAVILDLTRDPLPALDTAYRLRTFNAATRRLGVDDDPAMGGLPKAPRRDDRSPQQKARARKLRAAAVFLAGVGVIPLIVYASGSGNAVFDVSGDDPGDRAPDAPGPQLRDGYSNIHPADYVGVEACAECHVEKHADWLKHPHGRMNQDASQASILGDFSGARATYADVDAVFDRDGQDYRITLFRNGEVERRYRVTRTVGSRFTQMYVGVLTQGPEPEGHVIYSTEGKLPFGYWITRKRWYPVNYFDSDMLPDYDDAGSNERAAGHNTRLHRWERSCIFCHNTYAFEHRLRSGMQEAIGFPKGHLRLDPAPEVRRELPAGDLSALGIGCESCHFGGREHVQAEGERPMRFLPSAPDLTFEAASETLVKDGQQSAYVVNSICAQCHSARVTRYPNGASTWNSSEAHDMLGGACANAIKCTDCHDPHRAGPLVNGPDRPEHIAACVTCHGESSSRKHTRHSSGVSCLDCHMPRIVQGLDAVIRTHRISSPSDATMLEQAAPNACNLCHLDKSIAWTLAELQRGWAVTLPKSASWSAAYGSQGRPVGDVWRSHDVPITRLVATDATARAAAGLRSLARVLDALNDPNPVNRMFGMFSVERIIGRRLSPEEYDPTSLPPKRAEQVAHLRRALSQ